MCEASQHTAHAHLVAAVGGQHTTPLPLAAKHLSGRVQAQLMIHHSAVAHVMTATAYRFQRAVLEEQMAARCARG